VRVKGGAWDDQNRCFVYATHTHLRYFLPVQLPTDGGPGGHVAASADGSAPAERWTGESGVLRTLDEVVYPVAVRGAELVCLNRQQQVVALAYDPTEYVFKRALAAGEYARVVDLIRNGNMCGQALIAYLRRAGYPDIAMHFVEDANTKLALALDIERIDARAKRVGDLLAGRAHPSESAAVCTPAGFQHAEQFATRNDVKAGAEFCKEVQNGEIRVRLHRVANEVVEWRERGIEAAVVFSNCVRRIHIGRRAETVRDFFEIHSLAAQGAIGV
jgi:hypothetical protein